eukprot:117505-Chlamydomonas_euryale.AAC.2
MRTARAACATLRASSERRTRGRRRRLAQRRRRCCRGRRGRRHGARAAGWRRGAPRAIQDPRGHRPSGYGCPVDWECV